jgi:hypothetical protein
VVNKVEAAGVAFRLEGEKVRVSYPDDERRKELAAQIALLREQRAEVAAYLKTRNAIPPMPKGIRLISWNLKDPPVAIETCAVVTGPALFACTTLEQLRIALAHPRRWVGWSVPQLIDRLAQVGAVVALEETSRAQ